MIGERNFLVGRSTKLTPGKPHIFLCYVLNEWRIMMLSSLGASAQSVARHEKALEFVANLNVERAINKNCSSTNTR